MLILFHPFNFSVPLFHSYQRLQISVKVKKRGGVEVSVYEVS